MSRPAAKVIVNPVSGAGAGKRKWARIKPLLEDAGLQFDHEFTSSTLDGTELARQAVAQGYGLVVAVGGDGTINEVVNGLIGPDNRSQADLGVVHTGTANDFAHSLGLPGDLRQTCRLLTSAKRSQIDVGVVECCDRGNTKRRLFVSVAGAGFDAALLKAAKTRFKPPQAKLPYVGAFVRTIATHSPKDFVLAFGQRRETWRALAVLVSNGKYAGTMPFDREADMSDGQFEVMAIDLAKMVQTFPAAYLGVPDSYVKVDYVRSSYVGLESEHRLQVEADGEILGELPARFRVLPGALRVVA
jgi:diacylglycerol kinase (ATP)